jgi:hypothetical protein
MEDWMRCAYFSYNAKQLPDFAKIQEPLIQTMGRARL